MTTASSSSRATHSARQRHNRAASADKWLQQTNEEISSASRRLFQSQLVARAATERELRDHLPALCLLARSICHQPAQQHRTAIRVAFQDPSSQWLTRSAIESGASGFFCHLLLRESATSGCGDDAAAAAPRLVLQLLLQPVLTVCHKRLPSNSANGATLRVCQWRLEKPKYYAMACASVWETLLPFLTRGAKQHPIVFASVLDELTRAREQEQERDAHRCHHDSDELVNCRFAQIAGFWRLLEALGDTTRTTEPVAVIESMNKILSFAIEWSILGPRGSSSRIEQDHETTTTSDANALFYDLLMDKFFHDLHEFLFKCGDAATVVRSAFARVLTSRTQAAQSSSGRLRLAAFTATGCLLIKSLAQDLSDGGVLRIVDTHQQEGANCNSSGGLWMVVGMVSHIDTFDADQVLQVLHRLLDLYDDNAVATQQRQPTRQRRVLLFWVVYIIVSRQQLLRDVSCQEDQPPKLLFTRLQERFCSAEGGGVCLHDLKLMPLHWMAILWKTCFPMMSDDDIDAFLWEASATSQEEREEDNEEQMIQQIPFRHLDQYPSITKLLGPSFQETLRLVLPVTVADHHPRIHQQAKRRKLLTLLVQQQQLLQLTHEQDHTRQQTLLLPEVMEQICSFLSAKRLSRIARVCRAFASVSQSVRLWRALYTKIATPLKKTCTHGQLYTHDWRALYFATHAAVKKRNSRQRNASDRIQQQQQQQQLNGLFHFNHEQEQQQRRRKSGQVQICKECGCDQVLGSKEVAQAHQLLHQKHRCPEGTCRAPLTSATALKQHLKSCHHDRDRDHHLEAMDKKQQMNPFVCVVDGCGRSYKSAKWLGTHVTRAHGDDAISAE